MAKVKVPIPKGGENNLESKFLRAQSGDPEAVKEYREALAFNEDMIVRNDLPRDVFGLIHDLAYDHEGRERFQYRERAQKILTTKVEIHAHCMDTEFPKREKKRNCKCMCHDDGTLCHQCCD